MEEYITTIKLKLHQPSRRKERIIDEAMLNYTRAFQFLLNEAKFKFRELLEFEGRYKVSLISKWVIKNYGTKLKEYGVEPFIDSLALDFGALMGGYLNSKNKKQLVRYPSVFESSESFEERYDKLIESIVEEHGNSEDIDKKINGLIEKQGKLRPLFFCRYSEKRNYSLLYDPNDNRYYAKLYLMNVKNGNRGKIAPSKGKKFYYINKDKELFMDGISKKCYIIVPLSFGNFQERELKNALLNPQILKTSRLTKEKGKYYLTINLKKSCFEKVTVENYIGITRGMYNIVNYSIVNFEGELIDTDFMNDDNRTVKIDKLYHIANSIIKKAVQNKAQIILEKLNYGDKLTLIDKDGRIYKPRLNIMDYNKLTQILDYKVKAYGLPKPIYVSSIDIFSSCPNCNNNSKENRFSDKLIICTSCGMVMDIEKTGSINLAKKLIKYSKDKIRFKVVNTQSGVEFVNEDLDFLLIPDNPFDCAEEFKLAIEDMIKKFYDNLEFERHKTNFAKKTSMIKKLESKQNIFEIIELK